jgi:hypothetical protein
MWSFLWGSWERYMFNSAIKGRCDAIKGRCDAIKGRCDAIKGRCEAVSWCLVEAAIEHGSMAHCLWLVVIVEHH